MIKAFLARGHANVQATHGTTIEFTKENRLTPRGDCIIGVESTHDEVLCEAGSKVSIYVVSPCGKEKIEGICAGKATDKVIIRRSEHVSEGTVVIKANKAAKDLNRNLINCLSLYGSWMYVIFLSTSS